MRPTPQPGISDIALYVGGASKIAGANRVTKLSSNENPLGPAEAAKAAYLEAAGSLELYPSSDHAELRAAIGEVHGLDPERIVCGAGSDEIIAFLCNAYAGAGDEVIRTQHGFLMHEISARAAGATPVIAPERGRQVDVDAILGCVTEKTRLIFLANPGNPTGTLVPAQDIIRLADDIPSDCLLVLDCAYAEYVEAADYATGLALAEARENVVMTRTFSKIYGLGGLRIGFGYGPRAIMDNLNRIRGPFNLASGSIAAATEAVRDVDYTARCKAHNAQWREWLAAELAGVGIPSDPSAANFILAHFADEAEAAAAENHLQSNGILVRKTTSYGLPHCLRITIGDELACRSVATLLSEFKAK